MVNKESEKKYTGMLAYWNAGIKAKDRIRDKNNAGIILCEKDD